MSCVSIWRYLETVLVVTAGRWALPALSGPRPEMLLNFLRCTGQLPTGYLAPMAIVPRLKQQHQPCFSLNLSLFVFILRQENNSNNTIAQSCAGRIKERNQFIVRCWACAQCSGRPRSCSCSYSCSPRTLPTCLQSAIIKPS